MGGSETYSDWTTSSVTSDSAHGVGGPNEKKSTRQILSVYKVYMSIKINKYVALARPNLFTTSQVVISYRQDTSQSSRLFSRCGTLYPPPQPNEVIGIFPQKSRNFPKWPPVYLCLVHMIHIKYIHRRFASKSGALMVVLQCSRGVHDGGVGVDFTTPALEFLFDEISGMNQCTGLP